MADDELKTCVTCKHHAAVLTSHPFMQVQHGCARLGVRDLVTGQIIHQHCLTERALTKEKDACGWKAKYWEAKLN